MNACFRPVFFVRLSVLTAAFLMAACESGDFIEAEATPAVRQFGGEVTTRATTPSTGSDRLLEVNAGELSAVDGTYVSRMFTDLTDLWAVTNDMQVPRLTLSGVSVEVTATLLPDGRLTDVSMTQNTAGRDGSRVVMDAVNGVSPFAPMSETTAAQFPDGVPVRFTFFYR